jgi:hypothetical protein
MYGSDDRDEVFRVVSAFREMTSDSLLTAFILIFYSCSANKTGL